MDQFVEEKLQEWGLEKFNKAFKENEINRETFLLLDEEVIKEIVKPIGPRLKFMKELQQLKTVDAEIESCSISDSEETDGSASVADMSVSGISKSTASPSPTPSTSVKRDAGKVHRDGGLSDPAVKKNKKDFNVRQTLEQISGGKEIIKEMENGILPLKSRKRVVNTLVTELISTHGNRPSKNAKLAMAHQIVDEFPALDNEDHDGFEVWYTPGSGKHDASGFLENRIRNIRKRDPVKSEPRSSATAGPSSRLISTVNLDLSTSELEEADIAAMITWLKYHQSPPEQVREMMAKTCRYRIGKIKTEKDRPLQELLHEYPRLIDTDGMIEQDFRILFTEVSDRLFMKWERMCKLVMEYADKQVRWQELLHVTGKIETDEHQSNIALQIPPLLFPTGMKRKEGRKGPSQHATTEEAMKAYIQFQKIGTNMPSFLENVSQTQPFVLALGERQSPEQVFVVVERQTVKCASLLKAVDICFKLFYLLDIYYPWQTQNTWDFFQKFIFGLGEGKGKERSAPSVALFCNFLKRELS